MQSCSSCKSDKLQISDADSYETQSRLCRHLWLTLKGGLTNFHQGSFILLNERILNTRSQPVKATLSSNDKKKAQKRGLCPFVAYFGQPPPQKKNTLKCGKLPICVVYVSEKCHPRLTVSTLSRSNIGA